MILDFYQCIASYFIALNEKNSGVSVFDYFNESRCEPEKYCRRSIVYQPPVVNEILLKITGPPPLTQWPEVHLLAAPLNT